MRRIVILSLCIIFGFNSYGQAEFLSGLYFSSHEVIQDKRTTLNLTPIEPFRFSDGFSLEFDADFRKGDGYYGYIFRIIAEDKTNIDLVSNLEPNASPNFYLVLKDKVLFSYKWSEIPNGVFDKWLKIKIDVDTRNSKLILSFNGNKQEVKNLDISALKNFDIEFGACRNVKFLNTDVSPMSLKDIRILNSKNELLYYWKLSKHGENSVYDEIDNLRGIAENPIWYIDKHVKWKKIKGLEMPEILGITQDEEHGRIFIINNKSVYVLHTESGLIDTIPFAGGMPYTAMGKQIIFNRFTNELWSYSFNSSEISKFSFVTHLWSMNGTIEKEPDFWHHNRIISPVDSSLATFLGYGFYTYKSAVNRYSNKSKSWSKLDRKSQIYPRYLSGSGLLNDHEMLVFGGYGSKTGRQELSPEYYYDLYSLNLNDYTFKKLWTLDNAPATPFVAVEELVPDQEAGNFYTLVYNRGSYQTFLHLARFGISKNDYQFFNDSIPYNFLDTKSWATIFLDKKTSQLVAITSSESDISIYTIAYPPLMPQDVNQQAILKNNWVKWIIIGSVLILGVFVFIILMKIRKKKENRTKYDSADDTEKHIVDPITIVERKTSNALYFMGGFQLYNRKGQNITFHFSPTLKQLFLFVYLQTNKNSKGIPSVKLDEVLWFDKSGESAKNNRNVNISKLRAILSEVDGIDLLHENHFWSIQMRDPLYCDYTEIMHVLNKSKIGKLTEAEIHNLISLLTVGEFLPTIQTEWIDKFKTQFSDEMIDGIDALFKDKDINTNYGLLYHLSECILLHEPLNDEALGVKCNALFKLGKTSTAKKVYDSFCIEYKKALGIDYSIPFKEIIK